MYFGTVCKMLVLGALLVLPSVFAYGNRPVDYSPTKFQQGGQGGQGAQGSPVNYWSKPKPNQLAQGRNPAAQCFSPSTSSGLFTDCRPYRANGYPAAEAVCRCSKCVGATFNLLCHDGTWYLHPDVFDFPCDNCDTKCDLQASRQFVCADKTPGRLGDVRSCTCALDCREYDVECLSTGKWTQKGPQSLQPWQACTAQKTIQEADRSVEYNQGLIRVRCNEGLVAQGHETLSCQNGKLNSTMPQCVTKNTPGFGGGDGGFGGSNGGFATANGGPNAGFGGIDQEYVDEYTPVDPGTNPDPNQPLGGTDATLLHLPTPTPQGPWGANAGTHTGLRPSSSSVTSTRPKAKSGNFNYLYVLYAVLVVVAVLTVIALVCYCHKKRNPKEEGLESGVASNDQAPTKSTPGKFAAKK